MSFKKERRCSKFEHRECAPPVSKTDEKPPMENGGIVLTNVVSRIFSPFLALGLSQCVSLFLHGQGSGDWEDYILEQASAFAALNLVGHKWHIIITF